MENISCFTIKTVEFGPVRIIFTPGEANSHFNDGLKEFNWQDIEHDPSLEWLINKVKGGQI